MALEQILGDQQSYYNLPLREHECTKFHDNPIVAEIFQ